MTFIFNSNENDFLLAAKKCNSFWKEVLRVVKPFMLELLCKAPEVLVSMPLWGSHFFLAGRYPIKKGNFRTSSNVISFPHEIISLDHGGGSRFLTMDEFRLKFPTVDSLEYISIKEIVKQALLKFRVNLNVIEVQYPVRPALVTLLSISEKGCKKWTDLLKKDKLYNHKIVEKEQKWELSLGKLLGPNFWDTCYKNVKRIYFCNKLRWFHFQIVRGSLKTNRILSKFLPNVSENCFFCNNEKETIVHLFWSCPRTKLFSEAAFQYIIQSRMETSDYNYIFSCLTGSILSKTNLATLYIKYFVWISKCHQNQLLLTNFIEWFKREIRILRVAFPKNDILHFADVF